MRVSVVAASALCLVLLAGSGQAPALAQVLAQVPSSSAPLPSLGFMPPYEIARTVRRAGFDPLAPPLREGSIYVVRATDYRGILMRVVVDARSGAIRDATRIVAGPGSYGSYGPEVGMVPYEPLPNERPMPYSMPADFDAPPVPLDDGEALPPRPSTAHPVTRANVTVLPPLPRPRPQEIVARKPADDPKPAAVQPAALDDAKTGAKADGKPADAKAPEKTGVKTEVTGSALVAAPPAPAASTAPTAPVTTAPVTAVPVTATPVATAPTPSPATAAAKPAKSLEPPPIND